MLNNGLWLPNFVRRTAATLLIQTYDDDLHGGQRSTEVKYSKLCSMATKLGQKNHWCKIRMLMTFTEVKGQQRSNIVNDDLWLPNLVGLRATSVHAPFWVWYKLKGYYIILKKKWNLLIFHFFNGNVFLNIVIRYYLLMRRNIWCENQSC